MYHNVLQYWRKLEFFGPDWPVNLNHDLDMSKEGLPWKHLNPDPKYKTYFDLYLGRVSCQELSDKVSQRFKWDNPLESDTCFSCVCAIRVDDKGVYVPGSFNVSAFIWVLCRLLSEGDPNIPLSESECTTFEKLADMELMQSRALDSISSLASVLERIVKKLGLDNGLLQRPCYWAKQQRYKRFAADPELVMKRDSRLLGSACLRDIDYAIEQNSPHYLVQFVEALRSKEKSCDKIQDDVPEMKYWFAAERFPLGKWPTSDSLSLMQQLAVNHAIANHGICSINHVSDVDDIVLLKEVIADHVVRRAAVLATYEDPVTAFTHKRFLQPPDASCGDFYEPDPAFSQFGVLMTARAKEAAAVSVRELTKTIEDSMTDLFTARGQRDLYFTDIATELLGETAWGMVAAELGQFSDLQHFQEAFFCNKGHNVHTYFDHIKPSWEQARRDFVTAYGAVMDYRHNIQQAQKRLEKCAPFVHAYREAKDAETSQRIVLEEQKKCTGRKERLICLTERLLAAQRKKLELCKKSLPLSKKLLPFLSAEFAQLQQAGNVVQELAVQLDDLKLNLEKSNTALKKAMEKLNELEAQTAELAMLSCEKELSEDRARFGEHYADESFWHAGEDTKLPCPWVNRDYNILRETLFHQALQLHKAFILNCPPVKINLYRLNMLWDGRVTLPDKVISYAALLNTLFLVVPALAVPLAAIESFLEGISSKQLGLLLVLQAEQVAPQTALGALLRTQKALVVGDALPEKTAAPIPFALQTRFADEYAVPEPYRALDLSVKQFADLAATEDDCIPVQQNK